MAPKTTIDDLGTDLLENIVSRLPAFSFASADCVSRSWHHVCGRFLCRPKLSSACSFNDSTRVAVEEVVNKVLSEPIRPHFAIVYVWPVSDIMQEAIQLITAKLSSKVPVIFYYSIEIIGSDAISDEFKENKWGLCGTIMLTVGFVPGLKVKLISLLKQSKDPQTFLIDQFITDIREFSTSTSGCQSPAAIMIFCEGVPGMKVVTEKMDYAMSPETVIVGECSFGPGHHDFVAAVALVFVKDRNKPPGIGETRFHAVLSSGLSPIGLGATYTVDYVREGLGGYSTELSGHREGLFETDEAYNDSGVCIGVTKRRICSIGQEEGKWMTSLAYHNIIEPQYDEILWVEDGGIKTGDSYRFYRCDSCVGDVSNLIRSLKLEVCGCFIFSSNWRSVPPNAHTTTFLENFPLVPFGGDTCSAEIARGYLTPQESPEQESTRACLHENSVVYFIISYAPP